MVQSCIVACDNGAYLALHLAVVPADHPPLVQVLILVLEWLGRRVH